MKTHFQVTIHIASMEDYGVVSLNGEEAFIVCSETVGELATCLHTAHIYVHLCKHSACFDLVNQELSFHKGRVHNKISGKVWSSAIQPPYPTPTPIPPTPQDGKRPYFSTFLLTPVPSFTSASLLGCRPKNVHSLSPKKGVKKRTFFITGS